MWKKKNVIIVSICTVIVIGAGSGFVYWHGKHHGAKLANLSITQSPTNDESDAGSSLSVSSGSGANEFGQLGTNQSAAGASTGSQGAFGSADNTSSSSSNSAAEQALNPATFSQYNVPKYQDGQNAYYADLQVGTGTEISAGHEVAVIYKGWLTNGTLFGETSTSSNGQMQPFMFTYGANPSQVIPGWEEGLAGMKVGGIRLLIVPPAAAYGAAGKGPVPPNAVLVFAVELEAVQ